MQTLIEKLYGQKVGEQGLYRMFSPDEIRLPMEFPGIGIEGKIDCPGPKLPTEGIPLEVRLGYQAPQSLYVMYSFDFDIKSGWENGPADPGLAYDRLMRKKNYFYSGYAPNSLCENIYGIEFQYRAGPHEDFGRNHINFETINPIDQSILSNDHWY